MSQTTEKRSIGTKIKFFLLFRQLVLINLASLSYYNAVGR